MRRFQRDLLDPTKKVDISSLGLFFLELKDEASDNFAQYCEASLSDELPRAKLNKISEWYEGARIACSLLEYIVADVAGWRDE